MATDDTVTVADDSVINETVPDGYGVQEDQVLFFFIGAAAFVVLYGMYTMAKSKKKKEVDDGNNYMSSELIEKTDGNGAMV